MTNRGARAKRRANLRLLESVRLGTDKKREELETKYSAIPVLSAPQCQEAVARIRTMSVEAAIEFFLNFRTHRAGNGGAYRYQLSRDTRRVDDPEVAEAVERLNAAVCKHDEALLDLLVADLFGGRASYSAYEPWSKVLSSMDVLSTLMSVVSKSGRSTCVRLH